MEQFKTKSSSKRNILVTVFTVAIMFALAFFGLKIAVVTWLFFEGVVLLCCGFCLFLVARTRWEIQLKGDKLFLHNTGNRQDYWFDDIAYSDFIITQSDRQKEKNTCDLKIKDVPFAMYDVQNYTGLIAYLQTHYQ